MSIKFCLFSAFKNKNRGILEKKSEGAKNKSFKIRSAVKNQFYLYIFLEFSWKKREGELHLRNYQELDTIRFLMASPSLVFIAWI